MQRNRNSNYAVKPFLLITGIFAFIVFSVMPVWSRTLNPYEQNAVFARRSLEQLNREVEHMEHNENASPDSLSLMRSRRSDSVIEWRRKADAWLAAQPASADARRAVAGSKRAMEKYYMPRGALVSGQEIRP